MKKRKNKDWTKIFMGAIVVALVLWFAIIPIIFSLVYSAQTANTPNPNTVFLESFPIEALNDNQYAMNLADKGEVSYLKKYDKEIVAESVSTDEASFIESNDKPHVKVYYKLPENNPDFYLTIGRFFAGDSEPWYFYKKYVFYIPKGSLSTQYSVDLE